MEQSIQDEFMNTLKRLGNRIGSNTLFGTLAKMNEVWTADTFVSVKEALKAEGRIKMGRGRGGIIMSREEA